MSSDNVFRSREEELARLNTELAELRTILREANGRLGQIERHVKRAFGVQEGPKSAPSPKPKNTAMEDPSISSEEALDLFRELTDLSREQGSTAVEERLGRMSVPDLKLMCHELGVSFSSKPSRKNLHAGIRGRISESVMLSPARTPPPPPSDHPAQLEERGEDAPVKDHPKE
jgi:hypothetical protein